MSQFTTRDTKGKFTIVAWKPLLVSLAAVGILASGCMSLVAHKDTAVPLSNGIIEYKNPTFENRVTWIGWASIGAMTAGGAYEGYKSNVALRWTGWERRSEVQSIGNVALGAMAGLASSLLLTWITGGDAPAVTSDNAALWLEKLDDRMKLISADTLYPGLPLNRIRAIARNADGSYIIRSIDDAKFFLSTFPNSPHRDRVLSAFIGTLKWDSLPRFARLVKGLPAELHAMELFIAGIETFDYAIQIADTFRAYRPAAERRAADLTRTLDDLKRYSSTFPESPFIDTIAMQVRGSLKRNEIPEFLEMFPSIGNQSELRRRYVDSSTTTKEAIEAMQRYPDLHGEAERRGASLARSVADYKAYLAAFPAGISATEITARMNDALQVPELLPNTINTRYAEISPVISPDGRTLYFSRKYSPENTGGTDDPDEIWFSELDSNDQWIEARPIGIPLNRSGPDHLGAVTPDGNTLLLGTSYDGTEGLSLAHKTADGWSYPKKLNIANYYNNSNYLGYYLANDGTTLVLSIERYDTYGGRDIYVCFQQHDGTWSEPENLGSVINTYDDDSSPFLASDGVTLYFSSGGHEGYGGRDIFYSRRLDDTWRKWTAPVGLGATINTDDDESFFFIPAAGDYAYFASDHHAASGYDMDIVRIGVPEHARPRSVALITGRVVDGVTERPLEARIIYESLENGHQIGVARSDPKTGAYKIALPSGKSYGFRAEVDGYLAISDNIDLARLTGYCEHRRDLHLVPFETGQTVRMNNLFFDVGKSALQRESFSELRRMLALMQANPGLRVEITGHTDDVGARESNMALSRNRANAVRDYLVSQGVPADRVLSIGYAETCPVATNDTEEGRRRNRRVEFTIISK